MVGGSVGTDIDTLAGEYPQNHGVDRHERRAEGQENSMTMHIALQPLLALVAGILILIMPRLLNYVVAVYLILVGAIGLFNL
jgi:hypothetical protein